MRIVSLAPSNTEIIYALGAGNLIVADTRFCDYPAEAMEKPTIGGFLDINNELLQKFEPDVIMTSTFLQNTIVERYRSEGVKVMHFDPYTLNDVYHTILEIGKLVNKEENAMKIVAKIKRNFMKIRDKVKDLEKIRVYVEEWHKPPIVSGNWVPELIEIAGGIGLCKKGDRSREIDLDTIKNFDPELMIVSWCGFGEKADVNLIKERHGWQDLEFVKKNRIHVINDSLLNRPGPRLVDGARKLAKILHPNFRFR